MWVWLFFQVIWCCAAHTSPGSEVDALKKCTAYVSQLYHSCLFTWGGNEKGGGFKAGRRVCGVGLGDSMKEQECVAVGGLRSCEQRRLSVPTNLSQMEQQQQQQLPFQVQQQHHHHQGLLAPEQPQFLSYQQWQEQQKQKLETNKRDSRDQQEGQQQQQQHLQQGWQQQQQQQRGRQQEQIISQERYPPVVPPQQQLKERYPVVPPQQQVPAAALGPHQQLQPALTHGHSSSSSSSSSSCSIHNRSSDHIGLCSLSEQTAMPLRCGSCSWIDQQGQDKKQCVTGSSQMTWLGYCTTAAWPMCVSFLLPAAAGFAPYLHAFPLTCTRLALAALLLWGGVNALNN